MKPDVSFGVIGESERWEIERIWSSESCSRDVTGVSDTVDVSSGGKVSSTYSVGDTVQSSSPSAHTTPIQQERTRMRHRAIFLKRTRNPPLIIIIRIGRNTEHRTNYPNNDASHQKEKCGSGWCNTSTGNIPAREKGPDRGKDCTHNRESVRSHRKSPTEKE